MKQEFLEKIQKGIFLTDAGIETYIMYKKGFEIPHFSLFHLLNDKAAKHEIREYYRELVEVAVKHKVGMIFCGIHYRSSRDWGNLLGYSKASLADINREGIALYRSLIDEYENDDSSMLISGCIGPRGDAYENNQEMTVEQAEEYHSEQIATLRSEGADFVTALTFNSTEEAIGLVHASEKIGIPAVVSFCLDENGCLGKGESLREGIEAVDDATDNAPAYYMINCTHPIDFEPALSDDDWTSRLGGIRPNASSLRKGMLCQLGHLEEGDPVELGEQMASVARRFPHINVWGGCCGTDAVHIDQICQNVLAVRQG